MDKIRNIINLGEYEGPRLELDPDRGDNIKEAQKIMRQAKAHAAVIKKKHNNKTI